MCVWSKQSSLADLNVGTFGGISMITLSTKLSEALLLFRDSKISALPVVDSLEERHLINLFSKYDVIVSSLRLWYFKCLLVRLPVHDRFVAFLLIICRGTVMEFLNTSGSMVSEWTISSHSLDVIRIWFVCYFSWIHLSDIIWAGLRCYDVFSPYFSSVLICQVYVFSFSFVCVIYHTSLSNGTWGITHFLPAICQWYRFADFGVRKMTNRSERPC